MNTKVYGKSERSIVLLFKVILFVFVVLTIYPVLFVLLTSTKSTAEFYTNIWLLPKVFAWDNYRYAWVTAQIGQYFLNSVIVVGASVAATLAISSLAGYALAKLDIPHAELVMTVIFLSTMLPSESILMPMYLLNAKLRITGSYSSLILPFIGWGCAFATYIYRNFFKTVPTEILEAARIDGCGEVRTFYRIVLPMILPATATVAIFTFLAWWGELLWSSVELSASSLKTLPLGILAFVQSSGTNWGPLCAASAIIIIPLVLFFLIFQKYFIAGLTGGAVKG